MSFVVKCQKKLPGECPEEFTHGDEQTLYNGKDDTSYSGKAAAPEKKINTQKKSQKRLARKIGIHFANDMGEKVIGIYAGSITFFFFLSLIPLLILVTSLLPYTGIKETDLVTIVTNITPDIADGLVASMIYEAYNASTGLLPIPILVLVWSCAQAMLALIRGMNDVYGVKEHRSYLSLCLTSIIYTLLMLAVLILVAGLNVFGELIRKTIASSLQSTQHQTSGLLARGLSTGQTILLLLGVVIIFSLVYTFVPSGRRNYFYQLPGALFTTIAWQVFSFFFKLYVNGTNKYTSFYGSLATLAILMFWMYCCIYILLLGGHINDFFRPVVRRFFQNLVRRN